MKRVWSSEQSDILVAIKETRDNILIRSVAGSGKTSVLVEAAQEVPRNSCFLAFNKKIVTELRSKLPAHCPASTFHSLCLNFLKDRLPRGLKVDGYKSLNLIRKHCPEVEDAKWDVARLVGLLKNNGVGIFEDMSMEVAEELRENYDITNEDISNELLCQSALKVLKKNEADLKVIDFDDMLYMTLKFVTERGWNMHRFNTVFIDEAQDTNEVQLRLLEAMADRVIAVGDDYQAIYGFRGAGANSMPAIKELFNCVEYPMTISWRCPEKVAEIARNIVPHFRAREAAPEGNVIWSDYSGMKENGYNANNLIICRMNYPLFTVAIDLLDMRVPFSMTGKFPEMLKKFVQSFKCQTIPSLRVAMDEWIVAKREELTKKKKLAHLEREEDKISCLRELAKECTSVDDMLWTLDRIMSSRTGVKLSTIHGAKGLEAETVIILAPELMPSQYAKTQAQLQQEENLRYVAETRSMGTLVYVKGKANG
ncbi:ATP-dependent DNA helicase [Vibrio phage vB_VspS_VS-ABTNL-3]|nr:ATP-dependent DNA helicase [Vibrio phage vB_VspS_VS-ABTNL-3]